MDILEFLQAEQPDLIPLARVAAVPNRLDAGILAALLKLNQPAHDELEVLNQAGLLQVSEGDRISVHSRFRRRLLATWWEDIPAFREICQLGFDYLSQETQGTTVEASSLVLQELTYFALGADQPAGLDLLEATYVSARNRYQLGVCEQLLSSLRVLEPALAPEALQVLRYFRADLSLAYYQLDEAEEQFGNLATEVADPLRQALALLGLGRVYLAQHRWQLAFDRLRQAEVALTNLGQLHSQAVAHLAIGATYDDLAERSGGLYSGDEDRLDRLVRIRRSMDSLPQAVVRGLILKARPLVWLYFRLGTNPRSWLGRILAALFSGSSYQDWIIARLKVEAIQWLRSAADIFAALETGQELAEARERLAILYHQLGHPRAAQRLQDALLADTAAQRSEYRLARVRLVRGQLRAEVGRWNEALEDLDSAQEIMVRYTDWDKAGTAAELVGQVHLRIGNREAAGQAFRKAAEHFASSQDLLRRTEALAALEQATGEAPRESEATAYITRFPGDIYRRVRSTSLLSINGLTWASMLVVASLLGFVTIVAETLVAFSRENIPFQPPPADVVLLVITPFLPLIFIWLYRLLYIIIGGAFWAYRLPLAAIEEDPPEVIMLDPAELSRQNVDRQHLESVDWREVVGFISAERRWIGRVVRVGSRLLVATREQPFSIEGTTRFYQTLKKGLLARRPPDSQVQSVDIDYITSWWFAGLIALSVALGMLLVQTPWDAAPADCLDPADCPERLVEILRSFQLTAALIFFVLLAPLVIGLRTWLQHRRLERLIEQVRRS